MTRVLATGTFDILHPGHVYYLNESRKLGDELCVIVARESMIEHKDTPMIPEKQRLEMVKSLKPVDKAILGSEESIFIPLEDLQPDVITLGYDQHYSEDELRDELRKRGFHADVVRVSKKPVEDYEILSTGKIIERIVERRC